MVKRPRSHDPGTAWLVNGLAAIRAQIEELTRIETALAPVVRLLDSNTESVVKVKRRSGVKAAPTAKRASPAISTGAVMKAMPPRGEFSTALIADTLRAKRSNVYTILWRLQRKGVVTKTGLGSAHCPRRPASRYGR